MIPIRVLIADSHHLFLLGIRSILEADPLITIVGESDYGQEVIQLNQMIQPDLILMDWTIPDGREALVQVKAHFPDVKVIILTSNHQEQQMLEALQKGASGYLLKDILPKELVTFIHMAHRGELVLSGTLIQHMVGTLVMQPTAIVHLSLPKKEQSNHTLTFRQKEILKQVMRGLSNRQIAEQLFISENTVKNHIRAIMERMNINNRVLAAMYAFKVGLKRLLFIKQSLFCSIFSKPCFRS